MIAIQINSAGFQADFSKKIAATKNPVAMLLAAGREVGNQLKTYFQQKDADGPNKLGGQRTHFWLAVARTVNNGNDDPTLAGNTVTVTINHPAFAQKVFGGRIIPKEKKALTIPLTPAAYGKTVADFPGSFLIRTLKGAFIVMLGENITVSGIISRAKRGEARRQRATLNFLFKLVPYVDQEADPTSLPPQSDLEAAILARAEAVLNREMTKP
jgi:hypothetical protein